MSRGPGSFQRDILDRIHRQQPTTLETLRWQLADEEGGHGNLPKSRAFALERAVANLAKRGLLNVEKRALATVQEWLSHYPGKTHRRAVRQLRVDLLPVLAEWVRSDEGPGPLFSADENERFFARAEGGSLSARIRFGKKDRGLLFASRWRQVEPHLRALLAQSDSDDLFYLIARGKYLFTRAPVETRFSFGQLVDRCAAKQLIPKALLADLNTLRLEFIPPETVGALELKSVIYRFVTSVIHRHPDLKPEALEALYKARSDYLKTVPGFRPPIDQKRRRGILLDPMRSGLGYENGSILARLIDQTTFQKFHFLSLPTEGGGQKDVTS